MEFNWKRYKQRYLYLSSWNLEKKKIVEKEGKVSG